MSESVKYSLSVFYVDNLVHQMFAVKDGRRTNEFPITEGVSGAFDADTREWEIKGNMPQAEAVSYLEKSTDPFPVKVYNLRKICGTLYSYR